MITLVAVNYHCETHIVDLHASLLTQDHERWTLVVVDNGSRPAGAALLETLSRCPRVRVLDPGRNLGYLGAVDHAHRQLPDLVVGSAWVVVTNPDIRLADPGFLRGLAAFDPAPPRVLAPGIVGPDGRDQNPYLDQAPSRVLTAVRTVAALDPRLTAAAEALGEARRRVVRSGPPAAPAAPGGMQQIFAPHGSFMCFSAGYLDAGLDFRHELFLYGEEVAIAARCATAGVPVLWVPQLRVEHSRHATTASRTDRAVGAHRRRGAVWSRRTLATVRAQEVTGWPSRSSS